jgi:hypothetical protein
MVASEETDFTFDATYFIAAGGITKLRSEAVMRAKGNEADVLFASVAAQNLFDRTA